MKNINIKRYHGASWDEPLIMELGQKGERGIIPPEADIEVKEKTGDISGLIPKNMRRRKDANLPEISQYHVLQHYLRLSQQTMGMETGIDIGEGTCTL